jgi:hypothetical protein
LTWPAHGMTCGAGDFRPNSVALEFAHRLACAEKLARQVHIDDLLPLSEGHLDERRVLLQSGIVNENVERTEVFTNGVEHRFHLVLLRDISLKGEGVVAVTPQLGDHGLCLAVVGHEINADIRTRMTERQRDSPANAGTGSSHKCFLTEQNLERRTGGHVDIGKRFVGHRLMGKPAVMDSSSPREVPYNPCR